MVHKGWDCSGGGVGEPAGGSGVVVETGVAGAEQNVVV